MSNWQHARCMWTTKKIQMEKKCEIAKGFAVNSLVSDFIILSNRMFLLINSNLGVKNSIG
jgi:hypothetical protein